MKTPAVPEIVQDDLPNTAVEQALAAGIVAVDIETTGLDWEACAIATCQIWLGEGRMFLVQKLHATPSNLLRILSEPRILKVFHHAMFDLRFLVHHLKAEPVNIACTKIASKLLTPTSSRHSLKNLLSEHLGVEIDKGLQVSDWASTELTPEQVAYAIGDVAHLAHLWDKLSDLLDDAGRLDLLMQCVKHLPTRVSLDLAKLPDVYTY